MIIIKIYDVDLKNFKAWGGALDTLKTLTEKQTHTLECILQEQYPEGINASTLNDFLWFEKESISDWLGFKSWDALTRYNDCGDKIIVRIYNIKWDWDEEEPNLPNEVIHIFTGRFEGIKDEELLDEIFNWLSNEYEYCVESFKLEEITVK